ncbi:MAG: DUF5335 family protein [Gemmatimonadota bacterium]|nr:DUF5335 family protein [Gemmatimonadota bacterium]
MTRSIPRERWADELDRFTRRNAGRRTVLEVDELRVGAQRVVGSTLWGVSYDERDDEVDLMFGDFDEGREQLTHSIGAPHEIDVLAYEGGGDRVLRIGYESGQARLHVDPPL